MTSIFHNLYKTSDEVSLGTENTLFENSNYSIQNMMLLKKQILLILNSTVTRNLAIDKGNNLIIGKIADQVRQFDCIDKLNESSEISFTHTLEIFRPKESETNVFDMVQSAGNDCLIESPIVKYVP